MGGNFAKLPRRLRQRIVQIAEQIAQGPRRLDAIAQRAEIARTAAPDRQTAKRARQIGRVAQGFAQTRPQIIRAHQTGHRILTAHDGARIGQRSGKARAQLTRTGRRHRAIDGAEQAAGTATRECLAEFQIAPRGGIDGHETVGRLPHKALQGRQFSLLRQFQIADKGARRRKLRPGESAKSIERRHPVKGTERAAPGARIEFRGRKRGQRDTGGGELRRDLRIGEK